LLDVEGQEIGRGLTRLGSLDVARAAGVPRGGLGPIFGTDDEVVPVHHHDVVGAG